MPDCLYYIKGIEKPFTEKELINYLVEQDLSKLKTIQDAIQERSAEEVLQRQQTGARKAGGGRERVEPSKQREKAPVEGEIDEETKNTITLAANDIRRQALDMDEYEKESQSFEEWANRAQQMIAKGYNINALIDRMSTGDYAATPVENAIRKIYAATLEKELSKGIPSDELLTKARRFTEAEALANSAAGRYLGSLRGKADLTNPTSILDFYVAKMEINGVDELTENQKREVKEQFDAVTKANEEANLKIQELEELNAKLLAESEVSNLKRTTVKSVKRNYKEERKSVITDIREKLRKFRSGQGGLTVVPIPYVSELASISPDIAKLAKLYVEEGIDNLSDLVKKIYDELKDDIDGLQEKDVQDVIAGKYSKPRPTKTELQVKIRDLQIEAELLSKIESALANEPKQEKAQIKQNQRLKELRDQLKKAREASGYYNESRLATEEKKAEDNISDLQKRLDENDLEIKKSNKAKVVSFKLDALKEQQASLTKELNERRKEAKIGSYSDKSKLKSIRLKNESDIEKIKERIKNDDFETKEKPKSFFDNPELIKKYPQEYKEYLNSVVKKQDAQHEFELALAKDRIAKMNNLQKGLKVGKETINTFKAIKAGIDDSAVFVQGGLAVLANPKEGIKAFATQWQDFFNEARFKRRIAAIHENKPLWDMIEKSGLDILDPQALQDKLREESLGGTNLLERKYKIAGKEFIPAKFTTAPFERLFTSFGNELRLSIFLKKVEQMMEEGKTIDNSKKEYQDLASVVNNMTGRGKLHSKLQQSENLISSVIWSPKLMASSLNLLGVGDIVSLNSNKGYYRNMTPEMRKYAIGQISRSIGTGVLIMAAMALLPDREVDYDPRSVTFGQVKNTKSGQAINIFGRLTPIIRYIVMMTTFKKIQGTKEKMVEGVKETYKFLRGKMNPVAGVATDVLMRKDFSGKPYKLQNVPNDLITPLFIEDMKKGLELEGVTSLLTRALPSFIGLKVTNEKEFDQRSLPSLLERHVTSSDIDINTLVDYNTNAVPTEEKFNQYVIERDKQIRNGIDILHTMGVPSPKGIVKITDPSLSKEALNSEISKIKLDATKNAKNKILGHNIKSETDYMTDYMLKMQRFQLGLTIPEE